MQTTESCKYCEKIAIILDVDETVKSLSELPHTIDATTGTTTWQTANGVVHTLIPRSLDGRTARLDLFLCLDEDDLDDIDVTKWTESFLRILVKSSNNKFQNPRFVSPVLSMPGDVACWKTRHASTEPGGIGQSTVFPNLY